MNTWVKLLHFPIIVLLSLGPFPCSAVACDYYDASVVSEAEREALVIALDEFGLSLDSPEVQGMDNGELWAFIENMTDIKFKNTALNPHSEN